MQYLLGHATIGALFFLNALILAFFAALLYQDTRRGHNGVTYGLLALSMAWCIGHLQGVIAWAGWEPLATWLDVARAIITLLALGYFVRTYIEDNETTDKPEIKYQN